MRMLIIIIIIINTKLGLFGNITISLYTNTKNMGKMTLHRRRKNVIRITREVCFDLRY